MDDQDGMPDETAFRVETEFDAEPSEVWRAITVPESMGEWLGRPVEFTLETGAEGTVGDRDGDGAGEATVLGVEEVDAERRLVFRWASTTEAPTVVELELRPIGRRTNLTIVERPVPQGHMRHRTMNGMTARACVLAHAA